MANSGAGNVVVRVPSGLAAKIHTASGLGKVIVEAGFSKLDEQTSGLYYQIISSGAPRRTIRQVKSSQVNFLQQRDSCGAGYNCLISAYTDQIMYLKNVKSNLGL